MTTAKQHTAQKLEGYASNFGRCGWSFRETETNLKRKSLDRYSEVHLKFQHTRNRVSMWGHPMLYSEFQASLATLAKQIKQCSVTNKQKNGPHKFKSKIIHRENLQ